MPFMTHCAYTVWVSAFAGRSVRRMPQAPPKIFTTALRRLQHREREDRDRGRASHSSVYPADRVKPIIWPNTFAFSQPQSDYARPGFIRANGPTFNAQQGLPHLHSSRAHSFLFFSTVACSFVARPADSKHNVISTICINLWVDGVTWAWPNLGWQRWWQNLNLIQLSKPFSVNYG